jgi:hypothetical protein
MFGVTCHGALFMETTPGPPKLENYSVDVSHPGRTELDMSTVDPTGYKNISLASHVPVRFLSNPYWTHSSMNNSVSTFHVTDTKECTM